MSKREDFFVKYIVKAIKWGGTSLFLAGNTYLLYHHSQAYEEGQRRGQALHKQRQAERKKEIKQPKSKTILPEQLQPQYIERQVRKYKHISTEEKRQRK